MIHCAGEPIDTPQKTLAKYGYFTFTVILFESKDVS